MTGKIFRSIFFSSTCILLISFGIFLSALHTYFTGIQEKQLQTTLEVAARGVELGGESFLRSLGDTCRLTWIDGHGTVLYDSESASETVENQEEREEFQEALEGEYGESTRYSSGMTEKTVYRAVQLEDGSVLRISSPQATVLYLCMGLLRPLLLILSAAFILAILFAYKLAEKITRPLEDLDMDHLPEKAPYPELEPFFYKIRRQNKKIEQSKEDML